MQEKLLQSKFMMAIYVGAALMIVGSLLPWLPDLDPSLTGLIDLEETLSVKQNVTVVLTAVTMLLTVQAARTSKKRWLIPAIVTTLIIFLPIITAFVNPDDEAAILLGIEGNSIGYFLTLIGWIITVVCQFMGFKKFKRTSEPS